MPSAACQGLDLAIGIGPAKHPIDRDAERKQVGHLVAAAPAKSSGAI